MGAPYQCKCGDFPKYLFLIHPTKCTNTIVKHHNFFCLRALSNVFILYH